MSAALWRSESDLLLAVRDIGQDPWLVATS